MDSVSKLDIDKNLSKILKKYRLNANLTQEQLAEKIGISDKYISRIETGKSGIKTQTLIKIMNTLGITPNEIYKDFIKNDDVLSIIELSEKAKDLSKEKLDFLFAIIDQLSKI